MVDFSSEVVLLDTGTPDTSRERTCENNAAGENSSFIFTVCVKSVPRYHFKLAHVVLSLSKNFSKGPISSLEAAFEKFFEELHRQA